MPRSSPTLDECRYNPNSPYTSLDCTNQKVERLEQGANRIVNQSTTQQPTRTYSVPSQIQPTVPSSDVGSAATNIGIGALATVLVIAIVKGLGEQIGKRLASIGDKKT